MGDYDVAQICKNGHLTNSAFYERPEHNVDFCDKCGRETISRCILCQAEIRGGYLYTHAGVRNVNSLSQAPAFCRACGAPYPWTESKIEAARDVAAQLDLDIPERTLLEKSIQEIIRDTPRAPAEAIRFKSIVENAKPWGLNAFKEILIGVVAESAKKLIWPT